MAVNSFTIYKEYFDLITLLDLEEQKDLLLKIVCYMFDDVEPTLNDKQAKIFNNLKRPLDKSKLKSKATSKENQNEIKIKSKLNQNKNTSDVIVIVNNINNILEFIENNFNRTISSYEYQQIEELVKEYSNEIVLYAFQKTLDAGKKSLNYTKGILKHWKEDNLKTLTEIKNKEERIIEEKNPMQDEDIDLLDNYDWINGE